MLQGGQITGHKRKFKGSQQQHQTRSMVMMVLGDIHPDVQLQSHATRNAIVHEQWRFENLNHLVHCNYGGADLMTTLGRLITPALRSMRTDSPRQQFSIILSMALAPMNVLQDATGVLSKLVFECSTQIDIRCFTVSCEDIMEDLTRKYGTGRHALRRRRRLASSSSTLCARAGCPQLLSCSLSWTTPRSVSCEAVLEIQPRAKVSTSSSSPALAANPSFSL